MVKHPACAAAINSSGLVPFSFSKRVRNEYGLSASTPESVERVPLPARPVPCQTAFALRIMVRLLAVACSKLSRVSSFEIDRSDQVDRNVDVAACGFRVGANLVRFVHEGLGDVALDTGQADVEASAEEVAAVRDGQVGRQSDFPVAGRKRNRALETRRPPGGQQLLRIGADARRAGNRKSNVKTAIRAARDAVLPPTGGVSFCRV